jgi:chromosome segregation ATPase
MRDRASVLEEMIGEYSAELAVEKTRLDQYRLRHAKLELVREVLLKHEGAAAADRLNLELHQIEHHVEASEQRVSHLSALLATYRSSLDKLVQSAGAAGGQEPSN